MSFFSCCKCVESTYRGILRFSALEIASNVFPWDGVSSRPGRVRMISFFAQMSFLSCSKSVWSTDHGILRFSAIESGRLPKGGPVGSGGHLEHRSGAPRDNAGWQPFRSARLNSETGSACTPVAAKKAKGHCGRRGGESSRRRGHQARQADCSPTARPTRTDRLGTRTQTKALKFSSQLAPQGAFEVDRLRIKSRSGDHVTVSCQVVAATATGLGIERRLGRPFRRPASADLRLALAARPER